MSKKRTKKQKQTARHDFLITWEPNASEAKSAKGVKRQIQNEPKIKHLSSTAEGNTVDSAQMSDIIKTQKNIIKSLILAGIILGTEVVLYFFWK
jgi:hypothetical protein